MERFLIDDQGRTKKQLKPLSICPTLRREMHGNEPRVVETYGWEIAEKKVESNKAKGDDNLTKTHEFKYVSLFSGVGGFEQALNKLGGKCVLASEYDPTVKTQWNQIAYEILYGEKPKGDVREIDENDVPDHDLLVAGFPCQAFSVAGKRLGFEDTRGTLFFEVARIAKVKQPKVLLLENVKGLVSHDKGRTLNVIIQTLCDIGYTVDFEVLNSKYFGVPQNRERIFIIAIRDDLITHEQWKIEGNNVVAKAKRRIEQLEGVKTFNFDWPPQEEVTTRLRDILETDVDEKYYLSEEKTAKLVAQLDKELPAHFPTADDINNTLRTGGKGSLTAKHNYEHIVEPQMLGHVDLKGHDAIKRVYSTEGVSPTLTTMNGGHREPKIAVEQFTKGNGISCCIDANYTKGTAPGDVGKGRRTHVIEEVRPVLTPDRMNKRQNGRRFKDDGEEMFTLTAQDCHGIAIREATKQGYAVAEEGDAVNIQFPGSKTRRGRIGKQIANTLEASGINQGVVTPKYRIRKLTPRECFRLQGFPDSEFDKLVAARISNSQLYKMAGNAVTVNVVEELGKRILSEFIVTGE